MYVHAQNSTGIGCLDLLSMAVAYIQQKQIYIDTRKLQVTWRKWEKSMVHRYEDLLRSTAFWHNADLNRVTRNRIIYLCAGRGWSKILDMAAL
jgi:hypothetical protein